MVKEVTLTIDGQTVTVPEGTLIVDAAKKIANGLKLNEFETQFFILLVKLKHPKYKNKEHILSQIQSLESRFGVKEIIEPSIHSHWLNGALYALAGIEEFDFSYQPKINEKQIRELANLDFLTEAKNVLFLGPPGVGKTHLASTALIPRAMAR